MLLLLGLGKTIEKIRYIIPCKGLTFEVDEFLSPNNNLTLTEIELPRENTPFQKPLWVGKEETGDPSYYNTMM
ncbi:MAG: hypothetical protein VX994_00705 [Bacteroidota bacterium]|nr:hypothetical protein [Bacteroidota bacterium]